MKNRIFAMAALAAALLASCNKETEMMNHAPEVRPDGASVTITLSSGDDVQTRTFFDATATAEAWEKSLSSLSVFTFNASGDLILRRDFTVSELASKSATFSLPKSAAGTECSFYAVANYDASSAKPGRHLRPSWSSRPETITAPSRMSRPRRCARAAS